MGNHKKEEKVAERIELCKNCEHLIQKIRVCRKCGCLMPIKVRIKRVRCPIGKWDVIPLDIVD